MSDEEDLYESSIDTSDWRVPPEPQSMMKERLEKRIAELEEALRFYANPETYSDRDPRYSGRFSRPIEYDTATKILGGSIAYAGERARRALATEPAPSVGTDGGTVEGDSDSAQRRGPSGRDCDRAEQAGRSGPQARPAMPMPPRRCTEPEHCPSEARACEVCNGHGQHRAGIRIDDESVKCDECNGTGKQCTNDPLREEKKR